MQRGPRKGVFDPSWLELGWKSWNKCNKIGEARDLSTYHIRMVRRCGAVSSPHSTLDRHLPTLLKITMQ